MIILSNGHAFEYMVASGSLAFDGQGWFWERPLRRLGLLKPELFTVVIKTLTRQPRQGNLRWWKPWSCIRLMRCGSAVNKVGLTNPGIEWWCRKIGPRIDFTRFSVVGSIYGTRDELVAMTRMLNQFDFVALEVNPSCPNTGHDFDETNVVVERVQAVCVASRHPLIVKLSAAQDYIAIARGLVSWYVEAISLNSVPWEVVFSPGPKQRRSPLWRLERRIGGGGGGVSGKLAQPYNWLAVQRLAQEVPEIPVIGPSIMSYGDMSRVHQLGAKAVSFGAIHLRTPWRPTSYVQRETRERR